jgi:hypothetical protein
MFQAKPLGNITVVSEKFPSPTCDKILMTKRRGRGIYPDQLFLEEKWILQRRLYVVIGISSP